MADNTPIARVSSIQGQAFAKDKNGALRVLRVGDQIFEGEVVVSGDNSRINLISPDGRTLVVNANDTLMIDAEVSGQFKPDAGDAALLAASKDANKIIQAINDGGSLDELLEETAAGESGSGAGGGPSFVRLLRVAEAVDPLAFDFNTGRNGLGQESIFGGRNAQESVLPPSISATDDNAQSTGQVSVNEQGLLSLADTRETSTGSIVITAAGGFTSITVGGLVLSGAQLAALAGAPQTINTGVGTLTLTGYNAGTGVLSFTYTLNGAQNQPGATETVDSIALSVSGPGGTATSSLKVQIIDGFPQAFNDSNALSEDAAPNSVSGNVMTAGAGADSLSADLTQVSGVVAGTPLNASGNVGANVNGTYGTLILDANGNYSYTLDNTRPAVQSLSAGQTVKEIFTYTITDADGDASTATLTVTVTGTNDLPVITNTAAALTGSLIEAGHLDDGTGVAGAASASGTLSASDVDTGATQTWTLQGTPSATYGTMVLNATTGKWTYTLDNNLAATQALKEGQVVTQTYTARVTDEFGAYVDQTLTVTLTGTNDVPVITNAAAALAGSLSEAGHLDDGTVVNGTASATGTLSASDVDAGATQTWTLQGTPSTTYGTMVLDAATRVWTYTLNNNLAATQALKEGEVVTQTYTVRVTDDFGAYVDQVITLTLTGTNDVPVITNAAAALAGSLSEAGHLDDGTAVSGTAIASGTLTASDVDAGATQTWSLQGTPSATYGTMVLNPTSGVWTYTLNNNLAATQALKEGQAVTQSYVARVTDDFGAYVDQTITLTLTGSNDAPVITNAATALAGSVSEAGHLDSGAPLAGTPSATGTLSASDVDAGATQTWALQGTPSTTYGTMVLNPTTGVWTYTLDNNLAATQALKEGQVVTQTYLARVTDDFGAYVEQTITVTLTGTNDAPVAVADTAAVTEDAADQSGYNDGNAATSIVAGNVLINDSDVDAGDTRSVTGVAAGSPVSASGNVASSVAGTYGRVSIAANGSYTYTLDDTKPTVQALAQGQQVTDTFTYTITDAQGAISSTTLTVTITGTNDVPVITNTAAARTGSISEAGHQDDGTAVSGTPSATGTLTASDVDTGATQTWSLVGTPSATYGTMVLNPTTGVWTYTLNNGLAATQALKEGQVVTQTYTARVTDEFGAYVNQTITVTITGTNDVPVITNSAAALVGTVIEAGNQDNGTAVAGTASATGTLTATDVDSGATRTWSLQGAPSTTYGTMALNASTGKWTYTLNNNLAATQALKEGQIVTQTYVARVTDNNGAYVDQTISVTVKGTNDVPVITNTAAARTGSISEAGHQDDGTAVSGTPSATGTLTASDVDTGATQTWSLVGTPSATYGTMVLNPTTGVWTYTLNNGLAATQALKEGQVVTQTYTARVTDEFGAYVNQTITVTITGTNDVPVITNSAAALLGTVVEAGNLDNGAVVAGTVSATGTLTATDVDSGATRTWSLQGTPSATYGTMVLNASTGKWTYTLNNSLAATQALAEGQSVTETYTARVVDEFGAYVDQVIKVTITGTNDSPVAVADTVVVIEDAADQSGYNDSIATTTIVGGNVLGNDSDVDAGDTRSVTGVAAGSPASASGNVGASIAGTYGRVNIAADGSYTYTLDDSKPTVQALARGQTVTDTFTYTITDAQGAVSSTTLKVTVTGSNDTPDISVGVGDSAAAALTETDSGLTTAGTLSIYDVDTLDIVTPSVSAVSAGGTYAGLASLPLTPAQLLAMLTVSGGELSTLAQNASHGIGWTFNSGSQAFNFIPAGQVLVLTYTVKATDNSGAANNFDTQTVSITITGTNDGVIINNDVKTIAENASGAALGGNVLSNDTIDPDYNEPTQVTGFSLDSNNDGIVETYLPGTTVTVTTASGTLGVFTLNANGAYTFTPHQANYSGPVPVITYTAASPTNSGSATLTLTIAPVADAPGVSRDAASVVTLEDTALVLGLNAPTRSSDIADQNGAAVGDNPERLGLISLTGIPAGVQLLDGLNGNAALFTSTGGTITIRLSDIPASQMITSPGTPTLTLTTAQFEALRALPVAQSATNFTVTMSVTEYEVDTAGNPLGGVTGAATSSVTVVADVQAVTDPVDLKIDGSDTVYDATLVEDSSFNLTPLLSTSFQDVDGSEQRYIDLSGLPAGSVVNGVVVGASGSISIQLTGNNTLPAISLTPPANFSGDLTGITVTLRAKDTDADSSVSTQTESDSVTLNLHVTPVAGDVTLSSAAATAEDTAFTFLQSLAVTDTDGSETLTGVVVNALPAGWVIHNELGVAVFTGDGTTAYTVPAAEITNGHFSSYTLTPAAHSSANATISLAVTSTDTRTVDGLTLTNIQTVNLSQTVTVTAVAEKVGSDSNADGVPDLTLNPSFAYVSAGQEDQWFALKRDGFDLKAGWTNQDSDEQTFALLTPVLSGGSALGSLFSYVDGGGVTHTLTYTGTPLQIPMSALDTVQFKAVDNLSGTFQIDVQVLTIDTDPDTGLSVQAISGHASLTYVVFDPVADPVTLAVDAPAVGLEDTAIALVIRPTSADPSETFTVTISGIPAGATITYGGVVQSVSGGSVSIANFSSATALSITPPADSNVDIPLQVSAVSVDTSGGVTSTSVTTTLPLLVDVRGVADPVTLAIQSPLQTSEAVVDGNSRHIPLSSVLTAVTPADSDGSESVNVVISGVPAGIRLEGLTFLGGIGTDRLWSGTPAEIANAQLVLREANFSGTISFTVRAVSTENDGSSLSGATVPVSIQVAPAAEATLSTQTTAQEDTLTQVNFTLQAQHGDGNESLSSVWINAADLSGMPFTLYLGATLLSSALAVDGGWYKLTAAQAANVFVKSSANSDADGSFAIKYAVSDPSSDGTLAANVTQFDGVQSINVRAVTDATISHNDYAGGIVGGTATLEVKVTVTQQADANAGGVADTDGSERLLYFIIDNVPIGVTVEGGRYIGNTSASGNTGRWILDTPDEPFTTASLEQAIRFSLDGTSTQLAGLTQPITIIAHTQDTGGSERTSVTVWTLQTDPNFIDSSPLPGVPAATISHWAPEPLVVPMGEDAPSTLSTLIHADISGTSPYAVTITGLPAGSVVSGMMQTVIGGQTIWTAQGNGDNASLQALLAGISVTPPANWNSNQGPFTFTTTLTTYDDGGGRNDASMTVTPPVTPVSDAAVIALAAADVMEDGTATITLALSNAADGASAQVVGGLVYVRIDESAMDSTGGSLIYGGSTLLATTVSGVAGVPDGSYFILSGVGTNASLSLSYQPPLNASGSVTYTAYVQEQESGASNVATSTQHGSFAVSPANDGVTISAPSVSGLEDQRIALNVGVSLGDSSETISSITLSNVPDGFLVFAGSGSPGSMAINLGGGLWGIQLVGGSVPAYIALQPPVDWSGTVSNLQLGVWSGEADLDPVLTTSTLNVTVDGVADGISFTPTLSFGNEGQIVALNLNSYMSDHDGSELATLSIKHLGEHAAFYAGSSLLAATYDQASDTYTLSGLTSAQVSALGVIQKDGSYSLEVSGLTIDSPGSNASTPVSTTLALSIANVAATAGDDNLLYDGGALNGLGGVDTIELRLGENIDFTTASKPTNIERIDLMPADQNHSLGHLMLQDVLDMTGSGKTLTILGDGGDSVSLKDGSGTDQWVKSGAESSGGHDFDVYTNANDAAVKVLIEQLITRHIDP
jgi:VCBS repeat-containing protein